MGMAGFTDLELHVIALQVNGIRAGEIARLLACSRDAVYAVVSGVYAKTGLRNAPELTRWAMKWGLDEMPDLAARCWAEQGVTSGASQYPDFPSRSVANGGASSVSGPRDSIVPKSPPPED